MSVATAPVLPGTERFNALVRICRAKQANALWMIADAALEIAPIGFPKGASAALDQFAAEMDLGIQYVMDLRLTASRWAPQDRVSGVSVKTHTVLAGNQHLIRPRLSYDAALELLGRGRTQAPKSKVEVLREKMGNPTPEQVAASHARLFAEQEARKVELEKQRAAEARAERNARPMQLLADLASYAADLATGDAVKMNGKQQDRLIAIVNEILGH